MCIKQAILSCALLAVVLASSLSAQVKTNVPDVIPGAKPVTIESIKVHGQALEGNLEGDSANRTVIVYLPPGYATAKSKHYPVLYALHGYSIGGGAMDRRGTHTADR